MKASQFMKKTLLILATLFCLVQDASAAHIKGGFFTYEYLGPGGSPGTVRYRITLTVYMICTASPGQVSNPINFSIFDAGTNTLVQNPSVSITNDYMLSKVYDEPCITGNEIGCYYRIIVYDLASIELPATPEGYIVAYQRCCRIAGIINVVGSGNVGNTFYIKLPGTAQFPGAETNSSPSFLVNDTAVVCRNSFFQYSFQASDPDADSLSYSFCQAYIGGDAGPNSAPNPAANPPYFPIPYQAPYSGNQPMGAGVTINPITGIISGVAPDVTGQFVICVCVNEYRNGILIGVTRKELHVTVGDCNPLQARLDPKPTTCDGYTVSFQNDAAGNPPGTEYLWTFGEPASGSLDTSILPNPTHTYMAAGDYIVKLRVALAGGLCADSAQFTVKVYPGFRPGFIFAGGCFQNPFQFTDTSNTDYGFIDTWSWNFGDITTLADTSHVQNPQWTYPGPGPKTVTFIVTSSKGCIDTIPQTINVLDKPLLSLDFDNALICRPDAIQLGANGTGVFSWSPPVFIDNPNIPNPIVNPPTTMDYYVTLTDLGCVSRDTVTVNVVAQVTLQALPDTTICEGDVAQLGANSDGLQFSWTPTANISDPTIKDPTAVTNSPTMYYVTATIGTCSSRDSMLVNTVPYPGADAGEDPTICYNKSAQLNASIAGTAFHWTPISYLNNPTILNPISTPPRTTSYILSVYDTINCPNCCPKPGRDTVTVIVLPKMSPFAGRDTSVVVGQPLQFNGSGGVRYLWSPGTSLSDVNIYNPIGVYTDEFDSIRYKLTVWNEGDCEDSAFVTVRIFKTKPSVFVPTAFTPNNDGLNDVVRPIAVGIQKINYFSIYNRWGQLVYQTTTNGQGWNGKVGGKEQGTGVFVWMVSAVDYLGKGYFQKGTVTLIR